MRIGRFSALTPHREKQQAALLFDHGLLFLFDAITIDLDRRSAVTMVDHYDIFAHRNNHCRSRTR